MKQYSFNNHYILGFNGVPFSSRKHKDDQFYCQYGRATQEMNLRDACNEAAHLILNTISKDAWLCFSGGIDSEIMVRSFMDQRLPFKVVMFRFKNGENDHDLKTAFSFCEKYNLPYQILELDFYDWFKSDECKEVIKTSHSNNVTQLYLCWMIAEVNRLGGHPIIAIGDPLLLRSVPSDFNSVRYNFNSYNEEVEDQWHLYSEEDIDGVPQRFSVMNNLDCYPNFSCHTPNIFRAFIDDAMVHKVITDFNSYRFTYDNRFKMYSQYFNLEYRPRYHGAENIINNEGYKKILKEINPNHCTRYRIKYSDLLSLTAPESRRHTTV